MRERSRRFFLLDPARIIMHTLNLEQPAFGVPPWLLTWLLLLFLPRMQFECRQLATVIHVSQSRQTFATNAMVLTAAAAHQSPDTRDIPHGRSARVPVAPIPRTHADTATSYAS